MPPTDSSPDALQRSRYRRLPGRPAALRLFSRTSSVLWLGDDHLLQVEVALYTEHYRRFSYGDIQAILLRGTARGLVSSFISGVLAAVSGWLAWSAEDPGTRYVLVGLAALCLVVLAINLAFGKTCRCQLQTAAGPHPLSSLSRLRTARKALRLLTEKVEAAQGEQQSATIP